MGRNGHTGKPVTNRERKARQKARVKPLRVTPIFGDFSQDYIRTGRAFTSAYPIKMIAGHTPVSTQLLRGGKLVPPLSQTVDQLRRSDRLTSHSPAQIGAPVQMQTGGKSYEYTREAGWSEAS